MRTGWPPGVVLALAAVPVMVLVTWPGASASILFQGFVGVVVAALFFAAFPRGSRAWPACALGVAGAVYYFLVVESQLGSRGRLIGAILACLLAMLAVAPSIYGSIRDSLQAVREAKKRSAAVLARLKQG